MTGCFERKRRIIMKAMIRLSFNGFWREPAGGVIPAQAGIYVVYECRNNPQNNTVDLKKVIYIGEAENVRDRIATHEKWSLWRRQCGYGNEVCFSFAPIVKPDRQRAEAASIYQHRPPVNEEYKHNFPFDETTIVLTGSTSLLVPVFTVYRTGSTFMTEWR